MNNLNDFTDFEDGERRGWENDVGSLEGILKKEEGPNTFWSGKLAAKSGNLLEAFQGSLVKLFTFPGEKLEKGALEISFMYRVYPLEPGEAAQISVVTTSSLSVNYSAFWIDQRTPTGLWLQSDPMRFFHLGNRAPVLIGTLGGTGPGDHRKVDIDNIRVVQIPDK